MILITHRDKITNSGLRATISTPRNAAYFGAVVIMVSAMSSQSIYAREVGTNFTVAATVLPVVQVISSNEPTTLIVHEEDIIRGYVEVVRAVRMEMKMNSPGYSLEVVNRAMFLRRIQMKWVGGIAELDKEGGTIVHRNNLTLGNFQFMELGFRFVLEKDTPAGIYPWPLTVSISPL